MYTAIQSVFGMINPFRSIFLQISSSASPGPDDGKPGTQISSGSFKTLHCRVSGAILMKPDSSIFYFSFIYLFIHLSIYYDQHFLDFGVTGTCMGFLAEPGDFFPFILHRCIVPPPLPNHLGQCLLMNDGMDGCIIC